MTSATPARKGIGSWVRFGLAAVPWVGTLVVTPFVNQVEPFVFGMPFLLVWVVLCVVATSVCMTIIYVTDPVNRAGDAGAGGAAGAGGGDGAEVSR